MKKTTLLLLAIFAALLTAFGGPKNPQKTIKVSNGEEFINAIGNNTHIILKENIMDLQNAMSIKVAAGEFKESRYKDTTGMPIIEMPGERITYGYGSYSRAQLNIMSVENLTIDGGPDRKYICLDSYEADVLSFAFCKNITIQNIILGHEPTAGCAGSVTCFYNCSNVLIENSQLFGCGEIGINAYDCDNFIVKKSDIFDCSYVGVELENMKKATFAECKFADFSEDVLHFWTGCKQIAFNNCIFDTENWENHKDDDCEVKYNNCKIDPSLDFGDKWYEISGYPVEDYYEEYEGDGEMYEEFSTSPDPLYLSFGDASGSPSDQIIHVKNAHEFVKAIGCNRTIIVDNDILNLTECLGDMIDNGEISIDREDGNLTQGIYCSDNFDGWGLELSQIYNLTIEGKEKDTHIQITPTYADVLFFIHSKNITIKNLKLGHVERGSCVGDVLKFNSCENINIESCKLYGSGVIGIETYSCNFVKVIDTDIYDCSQNGIYYSNSKKCEFKNCRFYELGYPLYLNFSSVTFDKCSFDVEYWYDIDSNMVKIKNNCSIKYKYKAEE